MASMNQLAKFKAFYEKYTTLHIHSVQIPLVLEK